MSAKQASKMVAVLGVGLWLSSWSLAEAGENPPPSLTRPATPVVSPGVIVRAGATTPALPPRALPAAPFVNGSFQPARVAPHPRSTPAHHSRQPSFYRADHKFRNY